MFTAAYHDQTFAVKHHGHGMGKRYVKLQTVKLYKKKKTISRVLASACSAYKNK